MAEKREFKHPKTVGAAVDRLRELSEKKRQAQKVVDAVAEEERSLEQEILRLMEESGIDEAKGKKGKARIVRKDVPTIKDDRALYAWIRKTGDFSVLQKRLSSTAVRERWEAGTEIPGLDKFIHKSISIVKA